MNRTIEESTNAFVKGLNYTSGDTKVEAVKDSTNLFYLDVLIAALYYKSDGTRMLCLSNGGENTIITCSKLKAVVARYDKSVKISLSSGSIFWKRGSDKKAFDDQNCILNF